MKSPRQRAGRRWTAAVAIWLHPLWHPTVATRPHRRAAWHPMCSSQFPTRAFRPVRHPGQDGRAVPPALLPSEDTTLSKATKRPTARNTAISNRRLARLPGGAGAPKQSRRARRSAGGARRLAPRPTTTGTTKPTTSSSVMPASRRKTLSTRSRMRNSRANQPARTAGSTTRCAST